MATDFVILINTAFVVVRTASYKTTSRSVRVAVNGDPHRFGASVGSRKHSFRCDFHDESIVETLGDFHRVRVPNDFTSVVLDVVDFEDHRDLRNRPYSVSTSLQQSPVQ